MAIVEQEITRSLNISLNQEQREKLERAALATGQSLNDFALLALSHAADKALTPVPSDDNPLEKIIGIFEDEPLMDELMERVRADRRLEMQAASEAASAG